MFGIRFLVLVGQINPRESGPPDLIEHFIAVVARVLNGFEMNPLSTICRRQEIIALAFGGTLRFSINDDIVG